MSEIPEPNENAPQRPPRPNHVPFWPVLAALVFIVAVCVAGFVASSHARGEHLTVVTSTLPPRHATTTTAASANTGSTVTTAAAAPPASTASSADCTGPNLVAAAVASGQVDTNALGTISAPQYKCVSGYALARLVPSKPNEQSVTADYKLMNGAWHMLNHGDVNPPSDGVPNSIAAQLVLS